MTQKEMLSILAVIYANYQGQIKSTDSLLPLWTAYFGGLPQNTVADAVKVHIAKSEYFPKISDIVKILGSGKTMSAKQMKIAVQRNFIAKKTNKQMRKIPDRV